VGSLRGFLGVDFVKPNRGFTPVVATAAQKILMTDFGHLQSDLVRLIAQMGRKRCKRFQSFRPVFLPLLVNPPLSLLPLFGGVLGGLRPQVTLFLGGRTIQIVKHAPSLLELYITKIDFI